MPVIVLAGDEEFEMSRRAQALKDSLVDKSWLAMNYQRLENPPLSTIIDAAAALPFGPGNKLILIDRCDLFTKKRKGGEGDESSSKDKGKANELERFEQAMGSVAPSTYVIFACPHNFDKTLKTSKAVIKHAKMEEFAKIKYWPGSRNPELERFVQKEAKQFGATIDDEAIYYLLEGTEGDLRQISSELQKAATRVLPGKHISHATVVEISPFHSHVFALAEHWVSGHHKEVLSSCRELLSRQSAMPILAALQTFLSKWIYMRGLCEKYNGELPGGPGLNRRQLPLQELAKRVSAEMKAHPFATEKELKRIEKVPTDTLICKRLQLTKLEDGIKTGLIPEQHALELFLTS